MEGFRQRKNQRRKEKMETQYEKFMRIRSELIKQDKSLSEATNQAYIDAYHTEKPDQMSYKDR